MDELYKAILILGATGSGKTPFGMQLETQHLWGRDWRHFDFGENLRKVATKEGAAKEGNEFLSKEEISVIENSLKTNSLLEDKDFPVAEKILKKFLAERAVDPVLDVVILNGLPRHIGQAEAVDKIMDIRAVIYFSAPPSILLERIKSNAGGDRTERTDDSLEEISRKLEIFKTQTMPLLDYYKNLDRNILEVEVDEDTIPLYIIQSLQTMKGVL
ncbi:MAG: nucleoside monophosphate kinase [Spirochaetaceae bacterium]|nr:nucleoside monophosphate kinase [Spirochaetaceae bacterium]